MKASSKTLKHVTLGLGAVMMMGAGQAAFAHASILNTVNSGTAIGSTSFSRIGVNHACNATTPITPVVAQSVVIPTLSPIISVATVTGNTAGAYVKQTTSPANTVGNYLFTTAAGTTPVTTLANRFQLVQNKNVFTTSIEQRDSTGTDVIGWVSTKGSLQINEHGEVPFRFSNVFFGANSCVHDVVVQLAVADICKTNSFPLSSASLSTTQGVNLWIDNLNGGSPSFPAAAIENGAGTTNMTINRDPVTDPYPASCAGAPIVAAATSLAATVQANVVTAYTSGATPLTSVKIQPSANDLEQLQFPGWGTTVSGNTFQ